jgi:DNA-binding transcriptional MerR regulator
MSIDKDYTLEQLSDAVKRSPVTLRLWARSKILPAERVGNRLYVVRQSIFLQALSDGSLGGKFTHMETKEIMQRMGGAA